MRKGLFLLLAVLVVSAPACGDTHGGASPAGDTSATTTTEPTASALERKSSEFVAAYLLQAFTQRPNLNHNIPKDAFTQCVTGMSLGTARSVFGSRQLPPDGSPDRAEAENAAASEALSAVQSGIESAIASCSR